MKDIPYLIYLSHEMDIRVYLPAVIFEDNSAAVTITNDETAYMKKCKHFMMLINYVREQVELGLIDVLKVKGTMNESDAFTKKLRSMSFADLVNKILGWYPEELKKIVPSSSVEKSGIDRLGAARTPVTAHGRRTSIRAMEERRARDRVRAVSVNDR